MNDIKAQLQLYYGRVPSDGFQECWFDKISPERKARYICDARKIIDRYLPGQFVCVSQGIVKTEKEARTVIDNTEQRMPSSFGCTDPVNCFHGTIQFHRLIRFRQWDETHEQKLIAACKASGVNPCNLDRFDLVQRLKKEVDSGKISSSSMKKEYEKRIKSPDHRWLTYLEVY